MQNERRNFILTILLGVQIALVQFVSQQPNWVETYYSTGIYPYISSFFRILFGWIPFSFGDFLGIMLLTYAIRSFYKLIQNKFQHFKTSLLSFTAFLSVLYFCFYAFWGLNYFREPLAKSLGYTQTKYSTEALVKVVKKLISKTNKLQFKITQNDTVKVVIPYTYKEIYMKASNGYKNAAYIYPQFTYTTPSIKSSLVSLFQSYNGTSGYLNPITGEAQVNNMIPKTGSLLTTTHEIAHQIGFAAENEANFVGFLAAIFNNDIYFNYAGYRMALVKCLYDLGRRDKLLAKKLWKTVHKGIIKDFQNANNFWKQYENPIEPLLKKGYNSYLKANNQVNGIASYNYVVDLLISYFNDNHS
ncbi:DUF3810 domain-containing protein [Tenacibaculum maritimum]|uniref:DUF3810 domain-containing protein n=1 Tax=Tenacibaculum maritimum TaxID=107401 RepID=UPI0012E5B65E|nr:DUF3810 domain-containing protein [Tenacibaculum maritimum]CAA0207283.1 conserved membrane hypothetical protein [Tenacibaculum maritimum]